MMEQAPTINCFFADIASLYLAYMPFVKGGGLFVHSQQNLALGTRVLLSVHLPNEIENYGIAAKVVWLTPLGAQGNKPSGMGMQFIGDNSKHFCDTIETYLADMLESIETTDTI